MEAITTPNLIIGAGPAGLAVAGRLRKAGQDFTILEQSEKIAWSWHNHYDRLCLHTVKQLSHLPHLPFAEDYPLYVPREDLIRYYEDYAKHFDIVPMFGEAVKQVQKSEQGWEVHTKSGNNYLSPNVIFATGVNRIPHVPSFKGQEDFAGDITHSRDYRNPKPYQGKKVLVIGMGNTGAEIALDLAEAGVETYLSVRSPITIVPRDVMGNPVQLTAKKLDKLPFGFGDWLGTQIRKIVIGNLTKHGVPLSKVHPAQQLRETGKTPVIDLGTVKQIKEGKIKVRPNIDHFKAQSIQFVDGQEQAIDSIILATGYKARIEEFVANAEKLLDRHQYPKSPVAEGEHKGLYFIGFDNYKLGGILGTITTDSKVIVKEIMAN
ncbi:MAG: NAD(P)/FAD-dependent oxidoreductase [Bacteroidota bacterium]